MLFLVQSHVAVAARLAVSICGTHLNFTCVERNSYFVFISEGSGIGDKNDFGNESLA